MAKGDKRISINAIDTVMKEQFVDGSCQQWRGIDVVIKGTLSFKEMLEFVNDVVMSVIQEGGDYRPEVMDFAIKSNIVLRYTNLSLPDNLEHRYAILYNTDVVDFVCESINHNQLHEMIDSAKQKVRYLCGMNTSAVQQKAQDLVNSFDVLSQKMSSVLDGVIPEDIAKIAGVLSNGGLSEDKIVSAYLAQTRHDSAEETA